MSVRWSRRGAAQSTCCGVDHVAVVDASRQLHRAMRAHLHADGSYEHLLTVPSGISQGYEHVQAGEAYIQMQGNEVFKMAVNTPDRIVDELLRIAPRAFVEVLPVLVHILLMHLPGQCRLHIRGVLVA